VNFPQWLIAAASTRYPALSAAVSAALADNPSLATYEALQVTLAPLHHAELEAAHALWRRLYTLPRISEEPLPWRSRRWH
jgi:hypothetical protein